MLGLGAVTHADLTESGHDASDPVARAFAAAVAHAMEFAGATAPNPPVGCAILDRDGEILALAAHQRAGRLHAEALALQQCRQAGAIERATTAVVTLEPCNHTGRTGPCTEAILASPIRSVWIGASDPNPLVAGGGAARLREAGLEVLEMPRGSRAAQDCACLIAPFTKFSRQARPWVTVKQALDNTGSMIPPAGAKTFTSPASLILAHRLRRATDAIITGMGTILADAPHFTVRHVADHIDRGPRILAICDPRDGLTTGLRGRYEERGFSVLTGPDPATLLAALGQRGVLWAMIEAGPRLLARVEQDHLWDDWLAIRQQPGGPDRIALRSVTAATPLRLLNGVDATKGPECFPVS